MAERQDGLRDIVIEPTVSEDLKTGELSVSFDCESPVRARIVSPDGKTESNVVNGKLHVDDQNGIYVWAEANIESHGMGFKDESLAHRVDYLAQHIERDVRMVRTLRNHPSIIVWSQGNEAGCGVNFAKAREAIRELDPSRPVQYENHTYAREDRSGTTDINCPMYRTHDQCREYLSDSPEMPFIQCEYAHAMGNSTGGFADFWAFADRYDFFQGGFIWDFADQGLCGFAPVSVEFAFMAEYYTIFPPSARVAFSASLYLPLQPGLPATSTRLTCHFDPVYLPLRRPPGGTQNDAERLARRCEVPQNRYRQRGSLAAGGVGGGDCGF